MCIRVLIAEDDANLRQGLIDLLEGEGYEVYPAEDGQKALDCFRQQTPDLVLLDIMLPEIDGFEVCQRIKNDPATRDIPVIMLTAKKSREDMARGEKVGADWYITKPFKSAMVMDIIESLINK